MPDAKPTSDRYAGTVRSDRPTTTKVGDPLFLVAPLGSSCAHWWLVEGLQKATAFFTTFSPNHSVPHPALNALLCFVTVCTHVASCPPPPPFAPLRNAGSWQAHPRGGCRFFFCPRHS